jgi:WhiB family transcriptional regulator, redox-sensing transcriptional regulator
LLGTSRASAPYYRGHNGGVMDNNWMARGDCRYEPPATFFPSDGVGVEVAKRICATCPVREQCLEYALDNRIDHGVWGGTSERQRRRLLKKRKTVSSPLSVTL